MENTNSTFEKVSITTNSLTFFDENGIMLRCSFLDEAIAIQLCAPVMNGEKRTYPKEVRENILLTKDRAAALYDLTFRKVIPAMESKTNYNGGVFTSAKKDNIFEIRIQNGEAYVLLHRDIDANRQPKRTIIFKFASCPVIEKYNSTSGEFEIEEIQAQLLLFIKLLEGFVYEVNSASSHAMRYANRFTTDKIFKYLGEMAAKLGISLQSNGYSNNPNPAFDTPTNNTMPQINEVNDLDQLLPF